MQVSPDIHLPPAGRDYRLDVLRGIANWATFLDHIPNNVVNWVTTRNYGFSDAAGSSPMPSTRSRPANSVRFSLVRTDRASALAATS